MKVIHVCVSPSGGGAEFLVRELNKRLPKHDIKSEALFFTNPTNISLSETEHSLDLKNFRSLKTIVKLRKFIKERLKVDTEIVVHGHLTWPLYFLPFAVIGLNCRLLYTEHSTHNKRREFNILRKLEQFIYSYYEVVICISKGTKDELMKWLNQSENVNNNHFPVIYNGSRMFKLKPDKTYSNNSKLSLVSIGSLSAQKGFQYSIKAVKNSHSIIEKYRIIGEGNQREYLEKIIRENELEDIVELLGWVDEIEPYLHDSDISLIPSIWEGFGLVAVEALSAGLPVIASNISGLDEILKEDKCPAILVKKENSHEISKAIFEFHDHLSNKIDFRDNASSVAAKYSLKNMVAKYSQLYKSI